MRRPCSSGLSVVVAWCTVLESRAQDHRAERGQEEEVEEESDDIHVGFHVGFLQEEPPARPHATHARGGAVNARPGAVKRRVGQTRDSECPGLVPRGVLLFRFNLGEVASG